MTISKASSMLGFDRQDIFSILAEDHKLLDLPICMTSAAIPCFLTHEGHRQQRIWDHCFLQVSLILSAQFGCFRSPSPWSLCPCPCVIPANVALPWESTRFGGVHERIPKRSCPVDFPMTARRTARRTARTSAGDRQLMPTGLRRKRPGLVCICLVSIEFQDTSPWSFFIYVDGKNTS